MSRQNDYMRGRLEGMYYAFEQIKKDGIEAFEQELRFRKASGVTIVSKTKKELDEFSFAVTNITILFALSVLSDEFDFGRDECVRFMDRLKLKLKSMAQNDISWDEQQKIIEDELGIYIRYKE